MLENYTDDELRNELKRRAKEKRKLSSRKPTEYIYLKGVVYAIDNIKEYTNNGVRYKPFSQWAFRLADIECVNPKVVNWAFHTYFKCSRTKDNAPKVGDNVIVKIRNPKVLMPSNVRSGKII